MTLLSSVRIPDIATIINAMLGFTAIINIHSGNSDLSMILILMAAMADGVDGYLAQKFNNSSMGKYLDSLADCISFGVAPAYVTYIIYGHFHPYLLAITVSIYLICGILRLARFNTTKSSIPDFKGVPITAAAVVVASYLLMSERYIHTYYIMGIFILLSYLMVCNKPYPKFRGTRAMAILSVIFLAPIITYFILPVYVAIFATLLFLLMLLYLESPIMHIPRKYYDD